MAQHLSNSIGQVRKIEVRCNYLYLSKLRVISAKTGGPGEGVAE